MERAFPDEGLAIAVTLTETGLPLRGPERLAEIATRQQQVIDAIPAAGMVLKRRYRSLAGFSGWARRGAIEALARHPAVESIYLDGKVQASLAEGVGLIGADAVQALGITGAGVKIAVLDTGVDTDHPDIADDLVGQRCFCDTHPSPRRGCCPGGGELEADAQDDEGHGTSVSGIITGAGVAAAKGVAPDAEIVAVKVLDGSGGGSFSDIAAALDWILTERAVSGSAAEGIDIVNLSLGDGGEYDSTGTLPCSGSNTANAVAALHADGVAVFAASGNEGHDDGISFPACVAEAISVGGVYDASVGSISWCGNAACTTILCTDTTAPDAFACHSNSDELLDLLAPDWRTTTAAMGGGTTDFGGTSAASPYAAGQAALLLSANPALTPEQIRSHLKSRGTQVTNPDNGLSFTRTSVAGAVLAALPSTCGNGAVEGGEECDDGGLVDGDCCSAECSFESAASPCSDGDACTVGDACDGAGVCVATGTLACDDGSFCNGLETCVPASGCVAGTAPVLDDGVACTTDLCDETNDVVTHLPDHSACDDGSFCNGDESCDVADGCVGGTAPVVEDAVACTLDTCDEGAEAVTHTPENAACDDGDACTADTCDGVAGCSHERIPWCNTTIGATPRYGRAIAGLLLLVSGVSWLGRTRGPVGPKHDAAEARAPE